MINTYVSQLIVPLSIALMIVSSCTNKSSSGKSVSSSNNIGNSNVSIAPSATANQETSDASLFFSQPTYVFGTSSTPLNRVLVLKNMGTGTAKNLEGVLTEGEFAFSETGAFPGKGGTCKSSLEPQNECAISITYTPREKNVSVSSLIVFYQTSKGVANAVSNLSASKSPSAVLLSSLGTVDFKATPVSNELTFSISNIGTLPAKSIKLSVSNDKNGEFKIIQSTCNDAYLGTQASQSNSCSVTLGYTPQTVRLATPSTSDFRSTAKLNVAYANGSDQNVTYSVPLVGTKTADLRLVANDQAKTSADVSLPFPIDPSIPRTFILKNFGSYPATSISDGTFNAIEGFKNQNNFSLIDNSNTCKNVTLPPGATCSFAISYRDTETDASRTGIRAQYALYYSDDYLEKSSDDNRVIRKVMNGLNVSAMPDSTVKLSCAAPAPAICEFKNLSRSLGSQKISYTFSLTNLGNSTVNSPDVFIKNVGFKDLPASLSNFSVLPETNNSCPINSSGEVKLAFNQTCFFKIEYTGNSKQVDPQMSFELSSQFRVAVYGNASKDREVGFPMTATLAPDPKFFVLSAQDTVSCFQPGVDFNGDSIELVTSTMGATYPYASTVSKKFVVCNRGVVPTNELTFALSPSFSESCENGSSICALAKNLTQTNGRFTLQFPTEDISGTPPCRQLMTLNPNGSCVFEITYSPSSYEVEFSGLEDPFRSQFRIFDTSYPAVDAGSQSKIIKVDVSVSATSTRDEESN